MDPNSLGARIVGQFERLSRVIGSGNVSVDVTIFALLVSVFSLFGALWLLRRSKSQPGLADLPFTGGLPSRVDKVEFGVHQLRSDLQRSVDTLRSEMGHLRQEMRQMRAELECVEKTGVGPDPDRERFWDEPSPAARPVSDGMITVSVNDDELPPLADFGPDHSEERAKTSAQTSDIKPPETLAVRLTSTRRGFLSKLKDLFLGAPRVDADLLDSLEELLVTSDLGAKLAAKIHTELQEQVKQGRPPTEESLLSAIRERILAIHTGDGAGELRNKVGKRAGEPTVILIVGVNGVGKTTTVAKLASRWNSAGSKVLMVAADTFRAAAVKQLEAWGEKIGVPVVAGSEGAKPSTVVFDGIERAKREGVDVVLIDTAGRLHNKSNLMNELEGIRNVIKKHIPAGPHETLLVLDGSTGQNALSQAREFNEATPLSGIIVTKLDGTAKGGIVVAIRQELGVPVRFIGVGEGRQDLRPFVAPEFAEALLESGNGE